MSRIAAVFCCCITLAGGADARTYKVGVQAVDYYPIAAAAPPQFDFRGYARDVLDRFAEHEGIKFEYVPLPPRRMFVEFWADTLDFAFPDNPNWDKEAKLKLSVSYSLPMLSFADAVFTLPARKQDDVEQLKRLGVLLGWTPWKFYDRINQGKIKVATAPSPNSLILMALSGRVDGVNLAEPVARYQLQQQGAPAALVANREWMPLKQSSYYLSTIRHPELIKRFDQYLRDDEAQLAALRSKYGL